MQTNTISTLSTPAHPLRLANMQHQSLHADNTNAVRNEFSDTIAQVLAQNDPRWLFAARVQMVCATANGIHSIGQMNDLVECAVNMGFTDMHARAMVGIVEEAQYRNGLDRCAMDELNAIPLPDAMDPFSTKARWITFSVLFLWAFSIAGLMQLV